MSFDIEGVLSEYFHMAQGQASNQISGGKPAYYGHIMQYDPKLHAILIANPSAGAPADADPQAAADAPGVIPMVSTWTPLGSPSVTRSGGDNPINPAVSAWGQQIAPIGGSTLAQPTQGEQVLVSNVRNEIGYAAGVSTHFHDRALAPGGDIPFTHAVLRPGEWLYVQPSGTTQHWDNDGNLNLYLGRIAGRTLNETGNLNVMAYGGISFNTGASPNLPAAVSQGNIDLHAAHDINESAVHDINLAAGSTVLVQANTIDLEAVFDVIVNAGHNIVAHATTNLTQDDGDQSDAGDINIVAQANNSAVNGTQTRCGDVNITATGTNSDDSGAQTSVGNINMASGGANNGQQISCGNTRIDALANNAGDGSSAAGSGNLLATATVANQTSASTADGSGNIVFTATGQNQASDGHQTDSANCQMLSNSANQGGGSQMTHVGNILINAVTSNAADSTMETCANIDLIAAATNAPGGDQTNVANISLVTTKTNNNDPASGNCVIDVVNNLLMAVNQMMRADANRALITTHAGAPDPAVGNVSLWAAQNANVIADVNAQILAEIRVLAQALHDMILTTKENAPAGPLGSILINTVDPPTAPDDENQIFIHGEGSITATTESGSVGINAVQGSIGATAAQNITLDAGLFNVRYAGEEIFDEMYDGVNDVWTQLGPGANYDIFNESADDRYTCSATANSLQVKAQSLAAAQLFSRFTMSEVHAGTPNARAGLTCQTSNGNALNITIICDASGSQQVRIEGAGAIGAGSVLNLLTTAFRDAFNSHTHTGVTPGSGTSGPPSASVPAAAPYQTIVLAAN